MLKQTTEKSYLNRPKAHGITVRKLQFNPKAIRRQMEESGRGFALREAAERLKANKWLLEHAKV